MLTRFQRTKVVQLFRMLDLTRDGHIEYADFVVHAHNVKAVAGWDDDHPHAGRLLSSRRALWRKMHDAMDTNRDGEISLDEWLAFFSMVNQQAKTGPLPVWMEEMGALFFRTLDLDDDGRVTDVEYGFYLKSIGAEPADDLFRSALREGRRALTREDFQRVVASWLLNQDPNAPVNYVLTGRFPFAPSDLVELPVYEPEPSWEDLNRPIAVPTSANWESLAGAIREAAAEAEALRNSAEREGAAPPPEPQADGTPLAPDETPGDPPEPEADGTAVEAPPEPEPQADGTPAEPAEKSA